MIPGTEGECSRRPGPYPAMLNLAGRRCLVVGGGTVAARKVSGLLAAGARVVVVAPALGAALQGRADRQEIEWIAEMFEPGLLAGCRLVIAATDDLAVNAAVAAAAEAVGIWVNVVDEPELCAFIAPAVVRRGPVVVAISTGGASPALAKRLRQQMERWVGPEYGELADLLAELRGPVRAAIPELARREAFWEAALAEPLLEWMRGGQEARARDALHGLLQRFSAEGGEEA